MTTKALKPQNNRFAVGLPNEQKLKEATLFLRSVSHPVRLAILCCLKDEPKSVTQLVNTLEVTQPIVSQQLIKLKTARLVTAERRGHFVYYRLAGSNASRFLATLSCLS